MDKRSTAKFAAWVDKIERKYEGNCLLPSQIARTALAIAKSIDFYLFLLLWKSSWQQGVPLWKFKTLLWIPNHNTLSRTLNNINFYLSTFPAKINDKIFQNKEINLQSEFFLKNLAMYNCRGPPAFKCQRQRKDWLSSQKFFHHYRHAKIVQHAKIAK